MFRITSQLMEWLTIGGLLNLITIGGWGGLASLILHIVHWIKMARHNTVSATLADDHKTLTLASSLDGLTASSSVSVKSGDDTLIRSLASLDGTTAVMQLEVHFTGTVEVGVYSPGTALFGALRSYYPATLPDTNQPTSIKIASIGGDTLKLEVHDRVQVRTPSGVTYETQVLAVEGDTITVEDPVLVQANLPNELLIARMGHEDPAHWTNEYLLDKLNIGFMKYVNDPIGQFGYAYQFENRGLRISEFVIRNLLGTHGWCIAFLGYYWFDNAYQRGSSSNPTGYRSSMEQEASHNSGDTYSPIGSLHGDPTVVGDVGRYWLTANGGSRYGSGTAPKQTPNDLIVLGLQDGPGVHYQQAAKLTGGAANFAVPSYFYDLSATGGFVRIGPRGFVPVSPRLERTVGVQVAFSLPGACSVDPAATTGIDNQDLTDAADAQARGKSKISFAPAIADVAVTIATFPVAENTVANLIPFQRAGVSVTPNGDRVYRATPAEPGFVVDVEGNDLVVKAASGTDDVEISRFTTSIPTRLPSIPASPPYTCRPISTSPCVASRCRSLRRSRSAPRSIRMRRLLRPPCRRHTVLVGACPNCARAARNIDHWHAIRDHPADCSDHPGSSRRAGFHPRWRRIFGGVSRRPTAGAERNRHDHHLPRSRRRFSEGCHGDVALECPLDPRRRGRRRVSGCQGSVDRSSIERRFQARLGHVDRWRQRRPEGGPKRKPGDRHHRCGIRRFLGRGAGARQHHAAANGAPDFDDHLTGDGGGGDIGQSRTLRRLFASTGAAIAAHWAENASLASTIARSTRRKRVVVGSESKIQESR